jgi:hypothetical protein
MLKAKLGFQKGEPKNDALLNHFCHASVFFHGYGAYTACLEPIGHGIQICRKTGKFTYRLLVSIRRFRNKMGGAPNVDTRSVRVGDAQCCLLRSDRLVLTRRSTGRFGVAAPGHFCLVVISLY